MALPGYERVAGFSTVTEAEIVRGLLAASGIDARVAGVGHLEQLEPYDEIAVVVPAADVEQAREIVASARAENASASAPPVRSPSRFWRSVVVIGLMFSIVGGLALAVRRHSTSAGTLIVVGLVLAAVGALGFVIERATRAREDAERALDEPHERR